MKKRVHAVVLLVYFAAYAIVYAAQPAPPAFSAGVVNGEIVISNVTPGGDVVLFSCSRENDFRAIRVVPRTLLLHDETKSGLVRYKPKEGVALRSVWVAIDYASGAVATVAAPGFPVVIKKIPPSALAKDAGGELALLESDIPRVNLLVVRPNKGAWQLFGHLGGNADHGNGKKLKLAFGDCVSIVGKDDAPKHLNNGDVVAAIDPSHLDIFVAEIGK